MDCLPQNRTNQTIECRGLVTGTSEELKDFSISFMHAPLLRLDIHRDGPDQESGLSRDLQAR